MNLKNICAVFLSGCFLACSCGNKTTTGKPEAPISYQKISPDFNADSAYSYVDKQVSFGPRVPNTKEHVECGDYLVTELKRFGADVIEQRVDLKAYDETVMKARNIIGSYNKDNDVRVLLFAHWDTRPVSDRDPNPDNHRNPVLGANDGASGVGVLLEVARVLQQQLPSVGVDIIFFDAEDNGVPEFMDDVPGNWWCLGSQHWSKNPHVSGYSARYGILLDMVGAPDATFLKEEFSMYYASEVIEKIWSTARMLGYGKHFVDKKGGAIMDDHIPVNTNLNVPSIDIIQYDKSTSSGFGWYWHTQNDDMSNISKATLKAVGQTVLEVVYKEK
ncbi:glutamine cyclotransferase [Dysgonomonas sp. 216]|nr:M28 family peptidase [Dysgonomonas sp. 216]NDW18543.1 glutamine cyclotransferase [Dysgonomonas sp. 216]